MREPAFEARRQPTVPIDLEAGHVDRLYWLDTEDMVADGMTKGSIDREPILKLCEQGIWSIRHAAPVHRSFAPDGSTET